MTFVNDNILESYVLIWQQNDTSYVILQAMSFISGLF